MFPSDFLIFLQIILFLFITPGLPRVVIVSHTLNYGLNRSVWTALGDISANIIQGILVVFIIGLIVLVLAINLYNRMDINSAKKLFYGSIFYLTLIQIVYIIDKFL